MDFFIKSNSNIPILKYKVYLKDLHHCNINEILSNMVATFAMKNKSTGCYYVANKEAKIEIPYNDVFNRNVQSCETNIDYIYLIYDFKDIDTIKEGVYSGEFIIDNLSNGTKYIVPTYDVINIYIQQSFVKGIDDTEKKDILEEGYLLLYNNIVSEEKPSVENILNDLASSTTIYISPDGNFEIPTLENHFLYFLHEVNLPNRKEWQNSETSGNIGDALFDLPTNIKTNFPVNSKRLKKFKLYMSNQTLENDTYNFTF